MKKSIAKKVVSTLLVAVMGLMPAVNAYAEASVNGRELEAMMEHYGSDYIDANLDAKTQQLVTLATMTALQAYSQITDQTITALESGVTPEEN